MQTHDDEIVKSLRKLFPQAMATRLSEWIHAVLRGELSEDELKQRIRATLEADQSYGKLAGQTFEQGQLRLEFGANSQVGDVTLGTVVGHDMVIHITATEQAFQVHGLENPFLGLSAFTYHERTRYAGRTKLSKATADAIAQRGVEQALCFITGASGSGKSSFAQAGLIPDLQAHYERSQINPRIAVIRPGLYPLEQLADALRQLGTRPPADGDGTALLETLTAQTDHSQVNLIVIDQLEELFTQSDPSQRAEMIALLSNLPPFTRIRTHFIATLRSDFLPELFQHPQLYDLAKAGVDLRAMSYDDLLDAIQQPIQALHPTKHLEPALREVLAKDAAGDATYLPLLQVTLEDLWRRGSLVRTAYRSLSEAIGRRAEEIFADPRYDEAQKREMLDLFVDLVGDSLDEKVHRDVRRSRAMDDLVRGSPARRDLIDALVAARLLSKKVEPRKGVQVNVVEIIHESLIANWDRLGAALAARREDLRQRRRFHDALEEWLHHGRSPRYLLTGMRLSEAENLQQRSDIVFQEDGAKDLLRASRAQRDSAQRWKTFWRLLGVAIFFAIVALVIVFNNERQSRETAESAQATAVAAQAAAEVERDLSAAQRLALQALDLRADDPEAALLLAYEAAARNANPISEQALRNTLFRPEVRRTLTGHYGYLESAEMSPDGQLVITGGRDGHARIFSLDGTQVLTLTGHTGVVSSAAFSSDGTRILTSSSDGSARLWDLSGNLLHDLKGHTTGLWFGVFSSDGRRVATGDYDGTAIIWDLEGKPIATLTAMPVEGTRNDIRRVAFSPDGTQVLTAAWNGNAELWMVEGERAAVFPNSSSVNAARFQPQGTGDLILTAASNGVVRLWQRDSPEQPVKEFATGTWIWDALFTPDGTMIVTAASDGWIRFYDLQGDLKQSVLAHEKAIPGIAFSADGVWLLSASIDGTGRRWRLSDLLAAGGARQQPAAIYGGHTGSVWSVAFSPDGRRFATGGDDGTVRIWNSDGTFRELRDHIHSGRVWHIALDGERMLTASSDNTAKVWDADGELLVELKGHDGDVRRASFDPNDANRVLTASYDGTAILWDIKGTPLVTFTGHLEAVNSAVMSPDGTTVLTASDDNTARLWSIDGTPIRDYRHSGNVHIATFDRQGKRILTASSDGTARLWSVDGTRFLTLGALESGESRLSTSIESASFSPKEEFILTAGWNRSAQIWDANSGDLLVVLRGHSDAVFAAAFNPADLRFVVTTSRDGLGRLWQTEVAPIPSLSTLGQPTWLTSAVYSADGTQVLTAGGDGRARLWKSTGEEVTTFVGHKETVYTAELSPDGQQVLTASQDQTARLWAIDGTAVLTLTGHTDSVRGASFSPDGSQIATASADKTTRLWRADGRLLRTLEGHGDIVYSARFSPDGQYVLTASEDKTARLWAIDGTLIAVFNGHTGGVYTAALSADGTTVLTASWDDTARLWSREGRLLEVLEHPGNVRWAEFSPDGTRIVTAGDDAAARIWTTDGALLATLPGHKSAVQMARFSADGRRIVTASYDFTARQHLVERDDLLVAAACQADRRLDDDEIERYGVPPMLRMPATAEGCNS